jgi:hypothetical protein
MLRQSHLRIARHSSGIGNEIEKKGKDSNPSPFWF